MNFQQFKVIFAWLYSEITLFSKKISPKACVKKMYLFQDMNTGNFREK